MEKVKNILIILIFSLILGGFGGISVMAKEKHARENDRDDDPQEHLVTIDLGSASTTPTSSTSTPPITSTSTPPATSTTTPFIIGTTTTPPTTSHSTSTIIKNTTKNTTATSTKIIPVIGSVGKSGEVNDLLANAFYGSNYYGGSGLSVRATRSLAFIGITAAILGGALLASRAIASRRYYP